ncbi:Hypothetical protein CINCED_3A016048 [Cinara cedri]|uniref:Uncharacterized protein n=1 Tax=Cinara cedri TaxID=506608 RepID=A0A5E4N5Z8_9HEMI|nr:Hypothetical protein CINCED_3A016048 [Cinara cedri]
MVLRIWENHEVTISDKYANRNNVFLTSFFRKQYKVETCMAPCTEAVSIFGTLLCFAANLTKDTVITIILKLAKRESSGLVKCISLSNLGIFVCQELSKPHSFHPNVKEAIIAWLLALQANINVITKTTL